MHNNDDLNGSAQRALKDNIPATLKSASIELNDGAITWRCFFDEIATPEDKEMLSVAGTEILSDLPDVKDFKEDFRVSSNSEDEDLKILIFKRPNP